MYFPDIQWAHMDFLMLPFNEEKRRHLYLLGPSHTNKKIGKKKNVISYKVQGYE